MVDGRNGLTPQDKLIANKLRTLDKPILWQLIKLKVWIRLLRLATSTSLAWENVSPLSATWRWCTQAD